MLGFALLSMTVDWHFADSAPSTRFLNKFFRVREYSRVHGSTVADAIAVPNPAYGSLAAAEFDTKHLVWSSLLPR